MSRIGIVGLGNLAMPVALQLDIQGHDILSLSKTTHKTSWRHTTDRSFFLKESSSFKSVVLGAGVSKPSYSDLGIDSMLTLELAKEIVVRSGEIPFYYFSSGAIYGECLTPKSESDIPCPTTAYGKLKYDIELNLSKQLPDLVTSLRIGNVFGVGQKHGLIAALKAALMEKKNIGITSRLDTCRDYISESYFSNAVNLIIQSSNYYPKINIGTGHQISINEILEIFSDLGGRWNFLDQKVSNNFDVRYTRMSTELLGSIFSHSEDTLIGIKEFLKSLC